MQACVREQNNPQSEQPSFRTPTALAATYCPLLYPQHRHTILHNTASAHCCASPLPPSLPPSLLALTSQPAVQWWLVRSPTCAVTVTSLGVGHHEVCESLHVSTGLQHRLWCNCWALHLQHSLLQHKVLPPCLRHILLDRASWWAVICAAFARAWGECMKQLTEVASGSGANRLTGVVEHIRACLGVSQVQQMGAARIGEQGESRYREHGWEQQQR